MAFHSQTPVDYLYQQINAHHPAAAKRFQAATQSFAHDQPVQQVIHLNRYWRRQLAALSVDTIDAREALLDNVEPAEWERLFIRHVMPLVVDHQLPLA